MSDSSTSIKEIFLDDRKVKNKLLLLQSTLNIRDGAEQLSAIKSLLGLDIPEDAVVVQIILGIIHQIGQSHQENYLDQLLSRTNMRIEN